MNHVDVSLRSAIRDDWNHFIFKQIWLPIAASAKNIYLGKYKEKASISAWTDTTTGNICFDLSTQFSAAIYDI